MNKNLIYRIYLTLAILVTVILGVWIYFIDSHSGELIIDSDTIYSNILHKRQITSDMNKAARERSLVVLKMFYEKDIFERDEMKSSLFAESSKMNKLITEFDSLVKTQAQQDSFSNSVSLMKITAPQVLKVADFLLAEQEEKSEKLLFNVVLPNQDQIIALMNRLDFMIDEEGKQLSSALKNSLLANKDKGEILSISFLILVIIIFILIRKEFLLRESELKIQKNELDENNKINMAVLNTAPDCIFNFDEKGVIYRLNDAIESLLGYTKEELLNQNISLLQLSENDKTLPFFKIKQRRLPREVIVFDVGGLEIPILLSVRKTGFDGKFKYTCVFHDLRKIKETQLSFLMQQKALDVHSLVSMTDVLGDITYANDKFIEVSGYTKDELIGKNHRMLNSGKQPKNYWQGLYDTVQNGAPWHDTVCNKAKDGSLYWVDTTIVAMYDKNHKINGFMSIRTDITAQKTTEFSLMSANIKAEEATQAKSRFLATMSHEIRTPMNGVIGMTDILSATELDDEQKSYVSVITDSGKNLLTIINDILDFSKLDSEMTELESIQFDLELVCYDCISLIAGSASKKDIEFILDYDPDAARFFMGDPTRIRQVLINILGNAAKFTEKGLIHLIVKVEATGALLNNCKINISDTGIGLTAQQIESLFKEFTQADSTTTRAYGGTGLGLAISKKIINLMRGDIAVKSTLGQGSKFTISLPLERSKQPEHIKLSPLEGINVLFVDDNETNRMIFDRQINHMGMAVSTLENPNTAIEMMKQAAKEAKPYDIVILDHAMPIKSGLELGREIRGLKEFNDTKLLMFSSVGLKGDAQVFKQAGFNAYLNKLSSYATLKGVLSLMKSAENNHLITQFSLDENKRSESEAVSKFRAVILLVEDVPANQLVAKLILKQMGVDVILAKNGLEAVEQYKNTLFDLILMDCRMPVMDGLEATHKIREIEQQKNSILPIPIIALTANATTQERAECKTIGMNDMVTKPFTSDDIKECLRTWLPKSSHEISVTEISNLKLINESEEITEEHPSLDVEILEKLKETMGSYFTEMIEVSRSGIKKDIAALQQGDGSLTDRVRYAHSIKSPAAYIGAMSLFNLASKLQDDLKLLEESDGTIGKNETHLIKQLDDEFEKVCSLLKENQL